MEASLNRSTSGASESRRQHLAKLALALEPWFRKWAAAFPTHAVSKLQMATYIEALDDMSPQGLDLGCREATRVAEQFPKPGHIRKGLAVASNAGEYLGERADWKTLNAPPIPQAERDAAIEECRSRLAHLTPAPAKKEKARIIARPSTLSIDEQKQRLRANGWLK